MRLPGLVLIATLALGLHAGAAAALPAAGGLGADAANANSLVEKVHGCHRLCRLGPAGWHYHAGPGCVRVACGAHPGGPWIWHCKAGVCGWWHPTRRAWWR